MRLVFLKNLSSSSHFFTVKDICSRVVYLMRKSIEKNISNLQIELKSANYFLTSEIPNCFPFFRDLLFQFCRQSWYFEILVSDYVHFPFMEWSNNLTERGRNPHISALTPKLIPLWLNKRFDFVSDKQLLSVFKTKILVARLNYKVWLVLFHFKSIDGIEVLVFGKLK